MKMTKQVSYNVHTMNMKNDKGRLQQKNVDEARHNNPSVPDARKKRTGHCAVATTAITLPSSGKWTNPTQTMKTSDRDEG
jgi:hypothetical protein